MTRFRHSRSRSARTALGWCLAFFVGAQVGLALAAERWIPELRDPEYGVRLRGLRQRLDAGPPPFTVVMLGSSRTTTGLVASRLESSLQREVARPVVAYNFGVTGAGPILEELI